MNQLSSVVTFIQGDYLHDSNLGPGRKFALKVKVPIMVIFDICKSNESGNSRRHVVRDIYYEFMMMWLSNFFVFILPLIIKDT